MRILYGLFLVPVFVVLLFNSIVFVMVTVVLIKHTRKKLAKGSKKETSQGTIKAIMSIVSVMVMFGLSWLFGALSVSDGAIFFQWPFVIFNTLQGFILFIFSCVIGKDARDEWIDLLTCYRHQKINQRQSSISYSQTNTRLHKSGTHSNNQRDLTIKSYTFRKSEISSSTIYSNNEAPLLDHAPTQLNNQKLESISKETNLMTANDLAVNISDSAELVESDYNSKSSSTMKVKRTRKKSESVVPLHVLFRLNRPYYDVIVEGPELSQETDFSTDVVEMSDYDILTDDSTVALIDDRA